MLVTRPKHADGTAEHHTFRNQATHDSNDSCGRVIRPFPANAVTIVYGLPIFAVAVEPAMTRRLDREHHHRNSIRLRGYNYAAPGVHFVTINTQDRICLFGEIVRGCMYLNEAGMAARTAWDAIPDHFPRVRLDAFIVMPDHVHGIIVIVGATTAPDDASVPDDDPYGDPLVGATHASPLRSSPQHASPQYASPVRPHGPPRHSVGAIVGSYKSAVSRHINQLCGTRDSVVWQRNYYERIIRDYPSLQWVRGYIRANPRHWKGRG
jgi:putative transposase